MRHYKHSALGMAPRLPENQFEQNAALYPQNSFSTICKNPLFTLLVCAIGEHVDSVLYCVCLFVSLFG